MAGKPKNVRPKGKGGKPAPYRGKGASKGNAQDRREEEIADTAARMSRGNPLSFYTKFSQFAEDAGRIAFSRPLGAVSKIHYRDGEIPAATAGVMRLAFAPTVGVSNDYTSPLNRSSINFYARLRATQKAFGDYDHQDLTMMMLAIDSAIMFHALGRRIYGSLCDMSPINRYYPRAIVAACGVSFPDSQKNIQDFRAFLNEFALQIEQYALPSNIALFDRHSWMCEGLYVDSETAHAQTYLFVPTGFWQYDGTGDTGSKLVWKTYLSSTVSTPTSYTIDQFMEFGRSLINAMSNDADFAVMAGDLYAYYGGDVMKLPYIEEKYTILPKYDKTVLSQIENAVIAGKWASGSYSPVIEQNPAVNSGAVIFKPAVHASTINIIDNVRLNLHIDSPSSGDVMEATRLACVFGEAVTGGDADFYLDMCGTEIVQWLNVFNINPNTNGIRFFQIDSQTLVFSDSQSADDTATMMSNVLYLASFDWAPRVEYLRYSAAGQFSYLGCTWDLDNVTDVKKEDIDNLTTAALYSLFNVETR